MADSGIPEYFDLRKSNPGRVNDVIRDQENDPTCVAIAATELVQSAVSKKRSIPAPTLSVQQIVCGPTYVQPPEYPNTSDFLKYAIRSGITLEANYRYEGPKYGQGTILRTLERTKIVPPTYRIDEQINVPNDGIEKFLVKERLPVSISIEFDNSFPDWNNWDIYGPVPVENVSGAHRIVIIGYGKENDKQFYIIKNSFGRKWGRGGYGTVDKQWALRDPAAWSAK